MLLDFLILFFNVVSLLILALRGQRGDLIGRYFVSNFSLFHLFLSRKDWGGNPAVFSLPQSHPQTPDP